jgi:CheY-like chemotaxis protein
MNGDGLLKVGKKKILWVDDEIEHLRSHLIFLGEKGYDLKTASNGEDALEFLNQESVDMVLLDEQMPGRGGVSVLKEIRVRYPRLPVVMVTKSQEEEVMKKAIGRNIDGYLVKPINPLQVLSTCRQILEGQSIVQERVSIDFTESFRQIDEKRGMITTWENWASVYNEMLQWEMRLSKIGEKELLRSIKDLLRDFRLDFSEFVMRNYADWMSDLDREDRPIFSQDLVATCVKPFMDKWEKCLFIVVDCLRLDQWLSIAPIVSSLFEIEEKYYFSILPTATPYSRNAIFSGMLPRDMAEQYPDHWETDFREERSMNRHEDFFFEDQAIRLGLVSSGPVKMEKVFTAEEGADLLKRAHGLFGSKLSAVVVNFIDLLTHGRSESEILMEIAPDEDAFRSLTRSWFHRSALFSLMEGAREAGVPIILTSDHGSIHCKRPATVFAKRDASTNLRYKHGENVRAEKEIFFSIKDPRKIGLPRTGINVNFLFAVEDYYFVYPTKLREYQSRYYGSFLHGGISPEEMILPVVSLTPR